MDLNKIIISPKITEKTLSLAQTGKYTLLVHSKANKNQIKEALKKIYNVEPIRLNIINIKAKEKATMTRIGRLVKKRKAYKKAIVVLKKNQKIPGFEIEK